MRLIKLKLIIAVFIISIYATNGQDLNHEIGIFAGVISMQTDYGQRKDFSSSYGNVGFGVGAAYYVSFNEVYGRWNDRSTYMKSHVRLKLEFSYMSNSFKHHGEYTKGTSLETVKYNAMQGSTKLLNYGAQFEYLIYKNYDLRKWEPYVSAGLFMVNYNAALKSSLGDISQDASLLPNVYGANSVFLNKDKTQSFSFGGGSRYNLDNFTMTFDFRWQRFLSDTVDGLKPKIPANKYNDWLLFFNVGAVFKLN